MTNNSSAEAAKYMASLILEGGHLTVGEAVQEILSFINDSPYQDNVSFMEEVLKNVFEVCVSDQVEL